VRRKIGKRIGIGSMMEAEAGCEEGFGSVKDVRACVNCTS